MSIGIVIPVFNQLHYTKTCLESLFPTIGKEVKVVVVNNASSDGTREFLDTVEGIDVIHNEENLGCAPAWNQGVKHLDADWTVVLNNDTKLSAGWLEGLIETAEKEGLGLVCPAMREGELNYDFESYAVEFVEAMQCFRRAASAHGVCFAVHRSTFEEIGYFDEGFMIATYEDTDFWRRTKNAGIPFAITGTSFIHHFGFGTQKLHRAKGMPAHEIHNKAYFRKKWQMNWAKRKWERFARLRSAKAYIKAELRAGHSLDEQYADGTLRYR